MLAFSGVFAGKPLTTGATAAPIETLTSGAFAALLDSGTFTATIFAFARSAADSSPTPAGADTEAEALTDGVTAETTEGTTVGTTVGTTESVADVAPRKIAPSIRARLRKSLILTTFCWARTFLSSNR